MANREDLDSADGMSLSLSVSHAGHSEVSDPNDLGIADVFIGGNSPIISGSTSTNMSVVGVGDEVTKIEEPLITFMNDETILGGIEGVSRVSNDASAVDLEGLSSIAQELMSFSSHSPECSVGLEFVLRVYRSFVQSMRIQNSLNVEVSDRIIGRLEEVLLRERRVSEREQQVDREVNLRSREQQLQTDEVRLRSRRDEFEALVVRRVQDCLERITRQERDLRG